MTSMADLGILSVLHNVCLGYDSNNSRIAEKSVRKNLSASGQRKALRIAEFIKMNGIMLWVGE